LGPATSATASALFEFDLNGIVLAECGVIKFQGLADAPHFDPYNAVRLRIKVRGAAEHVGSDGNGFEAIPAPFQFLGNEILNQSPLTIRGRCQTVLENRCQALKQCFFGSPPASENPDPMLSFRLNVKFIAVNSL
jgi:hypothetical protein